jgi:dual specificity protein kinase YAK1
VHTDIKPENILTVSMVSQHVKLADFGAACCEEDSYAGYAQTRHYRSPEAILRLPLTCKSDIWSLGCVIAELTLGLPLLPGKTEVHQLFLINQMFGPFPASLIQQSRVAQDYFEPDGELKSVDNLFEIDRRRPDDVDWRVAKSYYRHTTLDDIMLSIGVSGRNSDFERSQRTAMEMLLQMITKLLKLDPEDRLSLEDAMAEPFMQCQIAFP